jgi:hypothetical protein
MIRRHSERQANMAETLQNNPGHSGESIETTVESGDSPATVKVKLSPKRALKAQMVPLLELLRTPGYPRWLIAAGAILGLMVIVTLVERVSERFRDARELRHEEAVLNVTPQRLIARCGQPTEDATKEVFPLFIRMISYQRKGKKLVLQFTRTAEETSDWVFLSMQDESGTRGYDSPDAKVAALPCLDSTK